MTKSNSTLAIQTNQKMVQMLNQMCSETGKNLHDVTNGLWKSFLLNSLNTLEDTQPNNWAHHQQVRNKIHDIH